MSTLPLRTSCTFPQEWPQMLVSYCTKYVNTKRFKATSEFNGHQGSILDGEILALNIKDIKAYFQFHEVPFLNCPS